MPTSRFRLYCCALFTLFVAFSCGEQQAPAPQNLDDLEAPSSGTMKGRVVTLDEVPLPKDLKVMAQRIGRVELKSFPVSDGGQFSLSFSEGSWTVWAQAQGQASRGRRLRYRSLDVIETLDDFVLKPSVSIKGRVVDNQFDPLQKARIEVHPALALVSDEGKFDLIHSYRMALKRGPPIRYAETQDDGTFVVEHLVEGAFGLRVRAKGRRGGLWPHVEVVEGAPTPHLEIIAQEEITRSGLVLDAAGEPIERVRVETIGPGSSPPGTAQRRTTFTDQHGRFRLRDVRPGRQEFRFHRKGFATLEVTEFTVADDDDPMEVEMTKARKFTGRLVDADDKKALADVLVVAFAEGLITPKTALTDDSGRFQFHGLKATETLRFYLDNDRYIMERGILPQNRDNDFFQRGRWLDLSRIPDAKEIEFLALKLGRLEGRVIDEDTKRGIPGVRLRSVVAGELRQGVFARSIESETDGDGEFLLAGVPPGEYGVMAKHSDYGAFPSNQSNPSAVFPNGDQRVLAPGGVVDGLVISMSKGDVIEGRIEDADGQPIAGARVQFGARKRIPNVYNTYAAGPRRRVYSDREGNYRLDGLPVVKEQDVVSATHPSFSGSGLMILKGRVGEAGKGPRHISDVDLTLYRGGRIKGHILSKKGKPLRHARFGLQPYDEKSRQFSTHRETHRLASDSKGRFAMSGLAPGRYRLFLETLLAGALPAGIEDILIDSGEDQELEIRLVETYGVMGRVVTGDGRPVLADLVLQQVDGRRVTYAARTTTSPYNGEFQFDQVDQGTNYQILVQESFLSQLMSNPLRWVRKTVKNVAVSGRPLEIVVEMKK